MSPQDNTIFELPDLSSLYNRHRAELLSLLESLPDYRKIEDDEQRIASAVCDATNKRPEFWTNLTPSKRLSYLVTAIDLLTRAAMTPAAALLNDCRHYSENCIDVLMLNEDMTLSQQWANIIADLWHKALELAGVDYAPPPPMPTVATEIETKRAIAEIAQWVRATFPTDSVPGETPPENGPKQRMTVAKLTEHRLEPLGIGRPDKPPQDEEGNSIRLAGQIWHLRYGQETQDFPKRGNKGIEYLAKLLASPNRALTVAQLRGDPEGKLADYELFKGQKETDRTKFAQVKERIEEIEDLDPNAESELQNEKAKLLEEIQRANDNKQLANSLLKAHHNIATQIRKLRKKLADGNMPQLALHLKCLELGIADYAFCYYPPVGTPAWKS